jgi:Tfp pilus assembly protein PilV
MVVRRGFGLVEVIVAALLLAGGLLTLAAAAVAARGRMTSSAADEAALRVAAALLDSLRVESAPESGSTVRDGARARWTVDGARIDLTLHYQAGIQGERERSFAILSSALLLEGSVPP